MKRFLLILPFIIIGLVCVIWFGGRWMLSFSIAEYDGEIHVPHLTHPVEITFDAKGIPQIWAETDNDLFFSIGWIHASERLFQMELIRRLAAGDLSEIFGDVAYEIDLFQRKIGFKRIAEEGLNTIDPETRILLEQYCRGINTWIEHKTILPPEFVLLQARPCPWTPLDCLTIMMYQTWFSYEDLDNDSQYNELLEKFGESLEKHVTKSLNWSFPTIQKRVLLSLFKDNRFPLCMSKASNSWVVSPYKSTTGAALHASDPHLAINQVPGFWYIIGMHSKEGYNFLGVMTPGLPFGAMGHNGSIAYAFTVAGVDIIDYYQYQRHPDDPKQILTESGYQELTLLQEDIQVKGEKQPRKAKIYMADRGVIVEETETYVVALKWAGFDFDPGEMMKSGLKLLKAQNFSEFREAVTHLGALNVNWTYSDASGNIGYQLGVPIPRRSYSNTYRRLSGTDSSMTWQGYYPLSETPYTYNPEAGWIATCNNRIVPKDWPYKLPGSYYPYRIARVSALLSQQETYSPQDLAEMQMDLISGIALQWKNVLAAGAEQLGNQKLAKEVRQWDGQMSLDSHLAALFVYWWEFLPKFTFEDDLGEDWRKGTSIRDLVLTYQLQDIVDDRRTRGRIETLAELSAMALEKVLPMVEEKTLGDISTFRVKHPLSEIKILDYWLRLNRGPFLLPGDKGTVNVNWTGYDKNIGKFYTIAGPSMRYILDWSDIDSFTIHTNLGQSGNPFSPHYDDFLDVWRKGERWVVPFSKNGVYAQKTSLLQLKP